jgi:Curli production assembly/transport component CsgG
MENRAQTSTLRLDERLACGVAPDPAVRAWPLEGFAQRDGVAGGALVEFGEGVSQQGQGARNGGVVAESGVGSDDITVDSFVIRVEPAGLFE